jgi:two-component sensor histidine kinase
MRRRVKRLVTPQAWTLSTKLTTALAAALMPMGVLSALLAIDSYRALEEHRLSLTFGQALSVLLPILMWLAALLIGWFAVHRLVVNPLMSIKRLIEDYGHNSDPARTQIRLGQVGFGSREIDALAASFDTMADEIDEHSRSLRNALVEQQRLTREVHHRVKNNLQIVSSLLSLHARQAATPEVAQTYATIQARILALTQVHRWMYDDTTSNGVDLRSLTGELCASLETSLVSPEHHSVTIACHSEAIIVHPDIAVPISFLVTELASLAARDTPPGPLDVKTLISRKDNAVTIAIASKAFVAHDRIAATNMDPAARIIHGMARQLRSVLVHDPVAGSYSVTFTSAAPT